MSEELIIRHCSPTLAGLKIGNLFTSSYSTQTAVKMDVRRLNKKLASKGLRILPLRFTKKRVLIYVYRPAALKKNLIDHAACELLNQIGYPSDNLGVCIAYLKKRLKEETEFPHEIGLFLGYPTEDVWGFIKNHAEHSKCTGCWKVYGDPQKTQKTFAKYKKCSHVYYTKWSNGRTIEQLTVAV